MSSCDSHFGGGGGRLEHTFLEGDKNLQKHPVVLLIGVK